MTGAGTLGPWPGQDVLEAQTAVMDRLGDTPSGVRGIPALVQLPGRGPWADSVGRTSALLPEMPVELGPHGWKLADRPGRDLERAQSTLGEDLDALAVAAHGWTGPVALSLRGPWTLASLLYLARGDRVLSDAGACRELVAALGEGVRGLVARVRGALPGVRPVLVLREPALPDVLAGTVASFSGFSRLRAPELGVVTAGLAAVVDAARAAGDVDVVVHTGGRFAARSVRTAAACGADAVGVALGPLRSPQWELLAELHEQGTGLWFALPREQTSRDGQVLTTARALVGPWRAVGLPPAALADVVVHAESSGGVAGGDLVLHRPQAVRGALDHAVRVALEVAGTAAEG